MKYLYACLMLMIASACADNKDNQKSKAKSASPNVIIILTDDQGWGDLHAHGNDSLHTPTLDFLARNSQNFDQFYVSPVCAPTRASMLTGRYPARAGVTGVTNRQEVMSAEEVTIAEILQQNEYATGMFGKWHNGEQFPNNPKGQGFDQFFGFTAGHWNNYINTTLNYNGQMVKTKGYITDILTDSAIAFIKKNQANPFFCYIAYNTPHSPFQLPDQYFEKYKAMGFDDKNASVYGMVENIDDNVSRVLNQINTLELEQNTVVIFFTDNGPNGHRFNGGMKGIKGHVDEGGIRVPFYLSFPGRFTSAKSIKTPVAHIDILPTVLDLCQIEVPSNLDGKSLVPLMENQNVSWPERSLYTNWGGKGSLRQGKFRLVIQKGDTMLYDLFHDPGQHRNIAGISPEIASNLAASYGKIQRDVNKNGVAPPPIPVGYEAAKAVNMPAHEAQLFNGLKYKEGHGWANDWIVNWKTPDAYATWPIEVVKEGKYLVLLKYNAATQGAKLVVSVGDQSVLKEIDKAFPGEQIISPDRVPRKEVYERTWGTLNVGTLKLLPGEYNLKVSASSIPEQAKMELKAIVLQQID